MKKTMLGTCLTLLFPVLAFAQTNLSDPPVTQATCPKPVVMSPAPANTPGNPVALCIADKLVPLSTLEVQDLVTSGAYKMFLKNATYEATNEGLKLKPVSAQLSWSGVTKNVAVNFNFIDKNSASTPAGKITAQIKVDPRGKIYLQYINSTIYQMQPGGATVGNQ